MSLRGDAGRLVFETRRTRARILICSTAAMSSSRWQDSGSVVMIRRTWMPCPRPSATARQTMSRSVTTPTRRRESRSSTDAGGGALGGHTPAGWATRYLPPDSVAPPGESSKYRCPGGRVTPRCAAPTRTARARGRDSGALPPAALTCGTLHDDTMITVLPITPPGRLRRLS